jgi:hypothetical protein
LHHYPGNNGEPAEDQLRREKHIRAAHHRWKGKDENNIMNAKPMTPKAVFHL